MPWMSGASRAQTFSGNRHKANVDKIVIHTTEGSSWPGYGGGGSAPHFTVHRDGTIRQHISTGYSSKALENDRGGVETNNDGVIQIENIGSCDRSYARRHGLFFWPDADDDDLMPLARVLAWIHETHGVPLTTRGLVWSDSNAAYEGAPQRMSFSQWRRFTGVCGHTHVPENAHWDPGLMDVPRAVELARQITGGNRLPVSDPDRPWTGSPRVAGYSKAEVRDIQHVLEGFDLNLGSYGADGSYGDITGRAVQQLQKELDITPTDGIYGPGTENAVMTIRSDIDYIKRVTVENQERIDSIEGKVKAAIDWHVPRVTFRSGLYDEDGNPIVENLASALRRANKHTSWNVTKNTRTEAKVEAILDALDQLPDVQIDVDAIKQAAFDGAAAGAADIEAQDVAELLELAVTDKA